MKPASCTIRFATPDDVEDILRIFAERPGADGAPEADPSRFRERLLDLVTGRDAPGAVWVADEDGAIVGWCSLYPMRGSPSMRGTMVEWTIYVTPDARSRGVARTMWPLVHDYAVTARVEWIVCITAEGHPFNRQWLTSLEFMCLAILPQNLRRPEQPPLWMWSKKVPTTLLA